MTGAGEGPGAGAGAGADRGARAGTGASAQAGAEAAPRTPNRLAAEQSPYLLQHAYNPVAWWPWGPEAIAEARRRGVPIFLSIGYSTCYWCHVMERESFESAVAAAELNRGFVPVKVDREQRPDIDELMMTACQVFTQLTEGRASGGWPLNCFVDPDSLEPFFCGTYFPPRPAFGRPSFVELLGAVEAAWSKDRAGLGAQARELARMVRKQMEGAAEPAGHVEPVGPTEPAGDAEPASVASLVSDALAQQVGDALMRLYDPTNGGFGGAPKFPTPPSPNFLFETRAGHAAIDAALRRTLDRMAVGGIFDQVGGGFHRYSVDATWTVPHFEKMLYDNGQLASLYARAAERWGDAFYAEIARRTCAYVVREMTGEEGRFLSAQDAEVEAREGGNYVWTPEEAGAALAAAGHAALIPMAMRLYGLDRAPNFQDPHHPEAPAVHVLRMEDRPEVAAAELGLELPEFQRRRALLDAALLSARDLRPQPMTDDKTIAAWTGLMVEGMAEAGRILREPEFIQAASRAMRFVLLRMRAPDGGLLRTWRAGVGAVDAFLDDYANMANGALVLWRATGDDAWLQEARALVDAACVRFRDPGTRSFFDTRAGQPDLFARVRSLDDGAVPSGTGAILRAMAAIAAATGDRSLLDDATASLEAIAPAIAEHPAGASGTILAARALSKIR